MDCSFYQARHALTLALSVAFSAFSFAGDPNPLPEEWHSILEKPAEIQTELSPPKTKRWSKFSPSKYGFSGSPVTKAVEQRVVDGLRIADASNAAKELVDKPNFEALKAIKEFEPSKKWPPGDDKPSSVIEALVNQQEKPKSPKPSAELKNKKPAAKAKKGNKPAAKAKTDAKPKSKPRADQSKSQSAKSASSPAKSKSNAAKQKSKSSPSNQKATASDKSKPKESTTKPEAKASHTHAAHVTTTPSARIWNRRGVFGPGKLQFPESWLPISNLTKHDLPAPHRFQPILSVEIGALGLSRSTGEDFPIMFSDGTSGPVRAVGTSHDLEPELKFGTRASVALTNLTNRLPGLEISGTFLSVSDTLAEKRFDASNSGSAVLNPFFYGGFAATPVDSYTAFLESNLDSAEIMLGYRPMAGVRLMVGARHLTLDERFDIFRTSSLGSSTPTGFFSHSENEATGIQIGGEGTLWTNGRSRAFVRAKYAFMNNEVRGSATAQSASVNYSGDTDMTLLDLEVGASISVSSWLAFQVAYQGLFLSDVVGALEQSDKQSFFTPASQVPNYHDVNFNGLHIGAVLTF